jgi:hypothetical protein
VDWTKGIATCADDKTKLGNYDLDGRCSRSLKVQMGGSRGSSVWRSISPWSPAYGQTSEAGLSNPSGILISVRIPSIISLISSHTEIRSMYEFFHDVFDL